MKIFNIVFTTIHKQVDCLGPRYRQNIDKKLFTEMSVDLQLMISKKSNYMFILLFNANNSCKCFTCVLVKIQRYT